jgi:hypothetical protein
LAAVKRVFLLALFPLRYYAFLTAPVKSQAPATVSVVEPGLADSLSA